MLALVFMVVVAYLPSLSGGFVWDDVIFTQEPTLQRWSGLWSIWLSPSDIGKEGHYWPIVYTSFWLEHKLWGLDPLGYHVVNVLLHAVNTVLVWRLLRVLLVPGAWAVAAVFAVHPMHVESVAWVIERKDLLSALFYLSAVLVWIRFTEAPNKARYGLALGLYVAGLLSKSIAVTLPAALLLWHWWQRGRVTAMEWVRVAPMFAAGLAITAADFAFYTSREPLALGYSLLERILIAGRALWFYVGKLLWPAELAVIYPLWEVRAAELYGWLYVVAAAGVAALLWFGRRWFGRGPAVGAAFFGLTLSPVLGFVDYGYMQFSFVADRFQYLAGIGVMAVLAGGAAHASTRLPDGFRFAAMAVFAAVVVSLGTLTWRQAGIYRDGITFFSHIVSLNPDARDAHLNLGAALFEAGRVEEGYAASRVAVEQRPDAASARVNLGRALLLKGRFDEAEEQLSRALALDPRNKDAAQNMAELRRRQGRYQEAVARFRKLLARDRDNALAHAGLGTSLYGLKRYEEAVASMGRALALMPRAPALHALHLLAGRAWLALGRFEEAERHLLRAAQITPGAAMALVDMGRLRFVQRRFDEADAYLRRAVAMDPGDAAILHNVAEVLREHGRYPESIERYRAALAIDPGFAMAHAGLGTSLYELERYEEAVESLARAVALRPLAPTVTARLLLMGKASERLDRAEAAVKYFERAVAFDPRNAGALDHLAMARFGQKRYEDARGLYRRMLEVDPNNAQAHANLGATLYHLGRLQDSLRSFERALSLDPGLETARAAIEDLRRLRPAGDDPLPTR